MRVKMMIPTKSRIIPATPLCATETVGRFFSKVGCSHCLVLTVTGKRIASWPPGWAKLAADRNRHRDRRVYRGYRVLVQVLLLYQQHKIARLERKTMDMLMEDAARAASGASQDEECMEKPFSSNNPLLEEGVEDLLKYCKHLGIYNRVGKLS